MARFQNPQDEWFQDLQDAVYDALCATFGVDSALQSSLDRFVPAYLPGVTTPQYNSDDNVCFYAISEEQGTNEDYITTKTELNKISVTRTIPISVLLTFYGPDADDDAELFWACFQTDNGHGSARSILRNNGIVPRGKPVRPVSIPELEGTLWRRRCDVRLPLACLRTSVVPAGMVEHVPDIRIISSEDEDSDSDYSAENDNVTG